MCAKENGVIVCRSAKQCRRIAKRAEKMEVDINYPITYYELINQEFYGAGINGFFIDNIKELLEELTAHKEIKAITINIEPEKLIKKDG